MSIPRPFAFPAAQARTLSRMLTQSSQARALQAAQCKVQDVGTHAKRATRQNPRTGPRTHPKADRRHPQALDSTPCIADATSQGTLPSARLGARVARNVRMSAGAGASKNSAQCPLDPPNARCCALRLSSVSRCSLQLCGSRATKTVSHIAHPCAGPAATQPVVPQVFYEDGGGDAVLAAFQQHQQNAPRPEPASLARTWLSTAKYVSVRTHTAADTEQAVCHTLCAVPGMPNRLAVAPQARCPEHSRDRQWLSTELCGGVPCGS